MEEEDEESGSEAEDSGHDETMNGLFCFKVIGWVK